MAFDNFQYLRTISAIQK